MQRQKAQECAQAVALWRVGEWRVGEWVLFAVSRGELQVIRCDSYSILNPHE